MESIADRLDQVKLPRVRDFHKNGIGADLQGRIDVAAHAVADHPDVVGLRDLELAKHAAELRRRLTFRDVHALERENIENAAIAHAAELIVAVAGLRVQGRGQGTRQAGQRLEGAVQQRRCAGHGTTEQRGPFRDRRVDGTRGRLAKMLVRGPERVLHAGWAEPEALAHTGIDDVMVHAAHLGFIMEACCRQKTE